MTTPSQSPPNKLKAAQFADMTADFNHGSVDGLVMDLILSFVDVKTLFRVAFCSKATMSLVTHEHVIRSAVITGGAHAELSVKAIVELLQEQTIVVPSPLRLLRLANGIYCERGNDCNFMKEKERGPIKVNNVRDVYGVFFCSCCLTGWNTSKAGFTRIVDPSWEPLEEPRLLRQKRQVFSLSMPIEPGDYFVWDKPFVDASGERAGAIITFSESQQLYDSATTMEEHLKKMEDANPWTSKRNDIIAFYREACMNLSERKKKEQEAERLRQLHKHAERVEKMKEQVQRVEDALDSPWKESIMSCKYRSYCFYSSQYLIDSKEPCVYFKCGLVNTVMEQFARAPSTSTGNNDAMKKAALAISEKVDLIVTKGFLDFSFLSDDHEAEPFESALRNYMQGHFLPAEVLSHEKMDDKCLRLIEQDKLFEAFSYRFKSPVGNGNFISSPCLVAASEQIVSSSFLPTNISRQHAIYFYQTIWRSFCAQESTDSMCIYEYPKQAYARRYGDSCKKYRVLLPVASEYVADVRNNSYFEDDFEDDESRQHCKDQLCRFWMTDNPEFCIQCLESRAFAELRMSLRGLVIALPNLEPLPRA